MSISDSSSNSDAPQRRGRQQRSPLARGRRALTARGAGALTARNAGAFDGAALRDEGGNETLYARGTSEAFPISVQVSAIELQNPACAKGARTFDSERRRKSSAARRSPRHADSLFSRKPDYRLKRVDGFAHRPCSSALNAPGRFVGQALRSAETRRWFRASPRSKQPKDAPKLPALQFGA